MSKQKDKHAEKHDDAQHAHAHDGHGNGNQAEPAAEPAALDQAAAPEKLEHRKKMSAAEYEAELAKLNIELVKFQEWIKAQGLKVVIVFEGRDAAGKGGAIKTITAPLNPRYRARRGPGCADRA